MIVNGCIENVKSCVMIGKSCIEIMNKIIIVFEIWDEIWIEIEILLCMLSSLGIGFPTLCVCVFFFMWQNEFCHSRIY